MGQGAISAEQEPLSLEDVRGHRDEILDMARLHGIRSVRVFGSVARGDADSRSDIDLLVDVEEGRSLLDLGAFLMDVQDLLGRKVDVVTPAALRDHVRARAAREAVSL